MFPSDFNFVQVGIIAFGLLWGWVGIKEFFNKGGVLYDGNSFDDDDRDYDFMYDSIHQ